MAKRFKRDIYTDEIVEVDEPVSPTGRSIIFKGELPFGDQTVMGRAGQTRSISETRPHVSKALGIHPAQADRFNAELREYGVTDATYSDKTGFLESTNEEHRAAAWGLRGHFDYDGGNVGQKWANALGY